MKFKIKRMEFKSPSWILERGAGRGTSTIFTNNLLPLYVWRSDSIALRLNSPQLLNTTWSDSLQITKNESRSFFFAGGAAAPQQKSISSIKVYRLKSQFNTLPSIPSSLVEEGLPGTRAEKLKRKRRWRHLHPRHHRPSQQTLNKKNTNLKTH